MDKSARSVRSYNKKFDKPLQRCEWFEWIKKKISRQTSLSKILRVRKFPKVGVDVQMADDSSNS